MKPTVDEAECWDRLKLVISDNGSLTQIINLNNRDTAIDVHQQIILWDDDKNEKKLLIKDQEYILTDEAWDGVSEVLMEWMGEYVEYFLDNLDEAEGYIDDN